MRCFSLRTLATLMLFAAPLRADDPSCLLFHPTVPTGSYSGSAALLGGPGGVLDRCSAFPGAAGWQLSHGPGPIDRSEPAETILLNAPTSDFGFWVGAKTRMSLRFFLGDEEQYATGWFITAPTRASWWQWQGIFDRVDVGGLHVLMLYGLDLVPDDVVEPLLEPPKDEVELELEQLAATIEGSDLNRDGDLIASTVPEPATLTLLASGLVGLAGAARRKREAKQL